MTTRKERRKFPPAVDYNEWLIETLKDPAEAAAFLEAVWEDGDYRIFCKALRKVAQARGGITSLARKVNCSRAGLYKLFSGKGNPELKSLDKILASFGLKLSVKPRKS